MKRIFIAIKAEAGAALLKIVSTLKAGLIHEGIKWINPDNIHITLAFLGNTEEDLIRAISSKLKNRCEGYGRFELYIRGTGVFSNFNNPSIIWAGIEPSEKLILLNSSIINGLGEAGVSIEKRLFKPHLTLGRIKYLNDKQVLQHLMDKYQNAEIQAVPVNEVIIYESILKSTGSLYKPIVIFRL